MPQPRNKYFFLPRANFPQRKSSPTALVRSPFDTRRFSTGRCDAIPGGMLQEAIPGNTPEHVQLDGIIFSILNNDAINSAFLLVFFNRE